MTTYYTRVLQDDVPLAVDILSDIILDPKFDPEELERHTLRYGCRCSRESLRDRLLTLPPDDLAEAVDEKGTCVLVCAYCDGSIAFGPDDLGLDPAAYAD